MYFLKNNIVIVLLSLVVVLLGSYAAYQQTYFH